MWALKQQSERLKRWTINCALPFWAAHAIDPAGGFYEYLDLDGRPGFDAVRRLRVQARQVYVYGLAHRLGWYPAGQAVAKRSFDFMCDKGYRVDNKPGFIHLLAPDYSVKNPLRDLYDHAFYILACTYIGAPGTSIQAALLDFIRSEFASPYGGWEESVPRQLPRRQNPHMHLFEAALNSYQLTRDSYWLKDWADPVYRLFRSHFFDKNHTIVREFFAPDWAHWKAPLGETVEPGHAAEWIWLLGYYQRLTGVDTSEVMDVLYDKVLTDPSVFLHDEEDIHGIVRRDTGRLWVQTELIKAHLAQTERGISGASDMAASAIDGLFALYLKTDGTWHDQLNAYGQPIATTIPVSTFYHIMCMATEADRVARISAT